MFTYFLNKIIPKNYETSWENLLKYFVGNINKLISIIFLSNYLQFKVMQNINKTYLKRTL